jgi:hypothetical protein
MLMYLLVWLSTSYLDLGLVGGFGDLLGRLEFQGGGLSGLFGWWSLGLMLVLGLC